MLDINIFRDNKGGNPELVRESQRRRFASIDVVDEIIQLDKAWRQRQFEQEGLRKEFNRSNKKSPGLRLRGKTHEDDQEHGGEQEAGGGERARGAGSLITAYSKSHLPTAARKVFDQIPHPNPFSWNALLSAYAASGRLSEIHQTFLSMPAPDAVSWNCDISAYTAHRSPTRAIDTYRLMLQQTNLSPSHITFSTMLIVSSVHPSTLGRQIHCHIVKFGFESYLFVGSPLVDMYTKEGLVAEAKHVFDMMEAKNVVMYNTMITGLLRCGMVEDSKSLFDEMSGRDSITWTTMVTGLSQNGLEREAVDVFREMRVAGVGIDQYTFGSVLTACGSLTTLEHGK